MHHDGASLDIQDHENTKSAPVVQLCFFAISLNPSHWVTNEIGGRGNTMFRCGLEVYREYI